MNRTLPMTRKPVHPPRWLVPVEHSIPESQPSPRGSERGPPTTFPAAHTHPSSCRSPRLVACRPVTAKNSLHPEPLEPLLTTAAIFPWPYQSPEGAGPVLLPARLPRAELAVHSLAGWSTCLQRNGSHLRWRASPANTGNHPNVAATGTSQLLCTR